MKKRIFALTLITALFVLSYGLIPPFCSVAIGISMQPTIMANDYLYGYAPKNVEDLKVGDIIVFEYEDMIIAHRIIEIQSPTKIVTQGDNVEIHTETVGFYDIRYVVTEIMRPGSFKYIYYRSLPYLIVGCVAALAVTTIWRKKK